MTRPLSHPASVALRLLGVEIAQGRRERQWTADGLARRCGVSEKTVLKVEKGDPGVAIGTVMELAAMTGVPIFSPDPRELELSLRHSRDRLALLPKRVRPGKPPEIDDDF